MKKSSKIELIFSLIRKYFFALTISVLISAVSYGQKKIDFQFDYAEFSYDSTSNFVEFYYSFPKNELSLLNTNKGKFSIGILKIKITNKNNGKAVIDRTWEIKQPFVKSDSSGGQSLVGVLGFRIKAGEYLAEVSGGNAKDTASVRKYSEEIKVVPFIKNKIQISHIELAKNIKNTQVNKKSIFYKNSYEVIPNPSIVFDSKSPALFYYVELYNLIKSGKHKVLKMGTTLVNSNGRIVYSRNREIKPVADALVQVGIINLAKYGTGTFNLIVTLQDTLTKEGAISGKKFFYYNPESKPDGNAKQNAPFISSEYGVLSNDDCDLLFDESRPIATGDEIDRYEKLTSLNAKREFLYNFWKVRDPLPQTSENEFKAEYLKRLKYVNEHFGTMNKPGYKTDRGRVYLKYGAYDQIERFPSNSNRKPYEIWYYNSIEGGVYFIFGDLTGYSDYELLHSTKRGELHDYDWQRRIIQN